MESQTNHIPGAANPLEEEQKVHRSEDTPGSDRQSENLQQVKGRIDDVIDGTASKLHTVADKLENYGEPGTQVGRLSSGVVGTIRRGAEYLESTDTDELGEQFKKQIRKQPLLSVGGAFVVGFLLARLIKS